MNGWLPLWAGNLNSEFWLPTVVRVDHERMTPVQHIRRRHVRLSAGRNHCDEPSRLIHPVTVVLFCIAFSNESSRDIRVTS